MHPMLVHNTADKAVFLKPVLEYLQPYTFCMSPSSTISHLIQLISSLLETARPEVSVSDIDIYYRYIYIYIYYVSDIYKMCSAEGTSWRGLRITAIKQRLHMPEIGNFGHGGPVSCRV